MTEEASEEVMVEPSPKGREWVSYSDSWDKNFPGRRTAALEMAAPVPVAEGWQGAGEGAQGEFGEMTN